MKTTEQTIKTMGLFFSMQFIIWNLLTTVSFSQNQEEKVPQVIIKMSPLGFMQSRKTIWLPVEVKLNHKYSIESSIGYIYGDWVANLNHDKLNFKINLELRYYKNQSMKGWYIAPNISYLRANYTNEHQICFNWEYDSGGSVFGGTYNCTDCETNRYKITRDEMGMNILIGHQTVSNRRIKFDIYAGIGYKMVSTNTIGKQNGIPNPSAPFFSGLDIFPALNFDENLNDIRISVPVGINIGIPIAAKTTKTLKQ